MTSNFPNCRCFVENISLTVGVSLKIFLTAAVSWKVLRKDGCQFGPVEQFGVVFDEKEFTVFQFRMLDLQTTVSIPALS